MLSVVAIIAVIYLDCTGRIAKSPYHQETDQSIGYYVSTIDIFYQQSWRTSINIAIVAHVINIIIITYHVYVYGFMDTGDNLTDIALSRPASVVWSDEIDIIYNHPSHIIAPSVRFKKKETRTHPKVFYNLCRA